MWPRRSASLKACWANGSASRNSKVTMPFRAMASSVARVLSCAGYASSWLRSPWSAMFYKRRSPSFRRPRSEVPRHRGVDRSLSRSTDVPAAAGITQRLLCLAAAATFGERDGETEDG
ncbi:UNVERIFIED_CONTAM: hypothetical protein NCL1_47320 [Trichonephila clavipes]